MKVLSLTHAQLNLEGLSPVSCERADSIVGTWADRLSWDIDVVHTANAKWPGIWPGGKGLKINIITAIPPDGLMMGNPQLFSTTLKTMVAKRQLAGAASLVTNRVHKRLRATLSAKGFVYPHELHVAKKWGAYLSALKEVKDKQYDFIFVCVGYGDEYLLQTGYTLSVKLKIPMIVDFRDLWSEHHEAGRFTTAQRQLIRRYEEQLLSNTILISVPQTHMTALLKKWVKASVYLLSHSAYVDAKWEDGHVIKDEFTMLYAGKLYPDGPGIRMLLEMIKQLSDHQLNKPFQCQFFVDSPAILDKMVAEYGVGDYVSSNGWISPAQLWGKIRSAHLLVIPDLGVSEDHPILPTKTFQYAYSGRQILCLFRYMNEEMKEFLQEHNAGTIFTSVDEATEWVRQLSLEQRQYDVLPPIRKIALREDIAEAYGEEINKIIKK